MGRRLRVMWRMRKGSTQRPASIVAPVRAAGPAARAPRRRRRAALVQPGQRRRPRRTGRRPGGRRLPAGVPGRGPGRIRRARLDRRRLPVHRRPPRADRPVGRRGRPPVELLHRRPAHHRGPRRGADLPLPGAAAHRGRPGPGRGAHRRRAVGPVAVGAALRGTALRRDGIVAPVADRRGAPPLRPPARRRTRRPHRAEADAGPGQRAERRGDLAGRDAGGHLGRGR